MKTFNQILNEAPNPNDPVMVRARARKMQHQKRQHLYKMLDKHGPKIDKLDEKIAQIRDEMEEVLRQQDFEAGMDPEWGDEQANSDEYGGRLTKLHDTLMKALDARRKLERLIYGQSVS